MKKLHLIPTPISEDTSCIPLQSIAVIKDARHFVCERVRTIRRFVKAILPTFDINEATFVEWDKRSPVEDNVEVMKLLKENVDIVFMSEAGSPCIADPGATLINVARSKGYEVYPYSGPSAIMLALMASGMDGQRFTFRGYLPVKKDQLLKELKHIEKVIKQSGYTQIFIETPYRNQGIYEAILKSISDSNIRMNISLDLNGKHQYVNTKTLKGWYSDKNITQLLSEKNPCIFILGR